MLDQRVLARDGRLEPRSADTERRSESVQIASPFGAPAQGGGVCMHVCACVRVGVCVGPRACPRICGVCVAIAIHKCRQRSAAAKAETTPPTTSSHTHPHTRRRARARMRPESGRELTGTSLALTGLVAMTRWRAAEVEKAAADERSGAPASSARSGVSGREQRRARARPRRGGQTGRLTVVRSAPCEGQHR